MMFYIIYIKSSIIADSSRYGSQPITQACHFDYSGLSFTSRCIIIFFMLTFPNIKFHR